MSGSTGRRSTELLLVAAGVAGVLLVLGPRPAELPPPSRLGAWLGADPQARLATLAGVSAWTVVLWLLGGFALCVVAAGTGRLAGVAERIARRVTPTLVRRMVTTALGVTLATGALATAGPALAGPVPVPALGAATVAATVAATRIDTRTGTLDAPPAPPVGPSFPSLDRGTAHPVLTGTAPDEPAGEVVVLRGDTLWGIAARHLGQGATPAQIDAEWRRWYAANRGVIGPNPDLVLPGQRLVAPTSAGQ